MAKSATTKTTKPLSKSEILAGVSEAVGEVVSKQQVNEIVEALIATGHQQPKTSDTFVLHGFAKFVVVKKPAEPARKGVNPFTKMVQTFAAKPASKSVRARPVKASQDAVV